MDDNEGAESVETETAERSTDELAADVIAEIAEGWQPDPEEGGDETESTAEEGAEPPVTEDTPTEETDRGTERLVAREVAVRQAEESLKAREAKVAELEAQNEQLRSQVSALPQDFVEQMRHQPFEALTAAGHDPEHTLRLLLAKQFEKDGKPVPQELRQAIREAEYDYKFTQQEKKLRQIEQQREAAAFVAKVESDAREYVSKLEADSKDVPLVAGVAKKNPARVHSEILDEIAKHAREAAGKNPNAPLLPFADAARLVEKRWAEMAQLIGSPAASTAPAGALPEKTSTQGTRSNVSATSKQKPVVAKQPLTKTPPKTQAELEKMAIDDAVQEYRRVESTRKAASRG